MLSGAIVTILLFLANTFLIAMLRIITNLVIFVFLRLAHM
ncbi:unnamed protein product, partial [Rotaria sp. Silwood1]